MAQYEDLKICPNCGNGFYNFCIPCALRKRTEDVEVLMDKYAMDVESLIKKLYEHVYEEGNFSALSLAIAMKNMKPATKADVTSGGKSLLPDVDDVKRRLSDKFARVAAKRAAGAGDKDADAS